MESLQINISTALASPPVVKFFAVCTIIWASPAFRMATLIVFVLATIWVIAKVYSGDLQNAEKGPVSIRRHSAGSMPRNSIVVHRGLIPMTMDGVHARCSFYYVYEDHSRKRAHVRLLAKNMTLSVSPSQLRPLVDVAKANEVPDGLKSHEVIWPTLEPDTETPSRIDTTPEAAKDYLVQNRVLERWPGDDALSLISLHQDVMEEIREARDEFIRGRVDKLRKAKLAKWFKALAGGLVEPTQTWRRR